MCERCGTFVATLAKVGGKRVCEQCVTRYAKELRLYPHGYVVGIGTLGNPVVAAALMAVNYKRLGERDRARNMVLVALGLGVAFTAYILAPINPPTWLALPIGLALSSAIARPYRETWMRLKQAGTVRANVFVPIAAVVVVMALLVGVVIVSTNSIAGAPDSPISGE